MTRYTRTFVTQEGESLAYFKPQKQPFPELSINAKWHDEKKGLLYVCNVEPIHSGDSEGPTVHEIVTVGARLTFPTRAVLRGSSDGDFTQARWRKV